MKAYINGPVQYKEPQYLWSTDWIQEYESVTSIVNKFCYANELNMYRFNQIFQPFDSLKNLNKVLGISCEEYNRQQNTLIYSRLGTIIDGISVIDDEFFWYCPKCMAFGFHSIFHQVKIFTHCIHHKNERLRRMDSSFLIFYNDMTMCKSHIKHTFRYAFKDIEEKNIKLVFSNWSHVKPINNKQFQFFMDLPLHFKTVITNQHSMVYLENILKFPSFPEEKSSLPDKKREGTLNLNYTASFLKRMEPNQAVRLDRSKFVDEQILDGLRKDSWRWGKYDLEMGSVDEDKKVKSIQCAKHMNHYYREGYIAFRCSLWDIRSALIHYVKRLLVTHKKCIAYYNHHPDAIRKNNREHGNHYCLVACFFKRLSERQRVMESRMELIRPFWSDSPTIAHRKAVLNEFTRYSQYLYNVYSHEFRKPIDYTKLDIQLTDAYSFRMYYEIFNQLIYQMLVDDDIITNAESIPKLRVVTSDQKVWFYPSKQISELIQKLLIYVDQNHLCNMIAFKK